jgi:hypothetical protein
VPLGILKLTVETEREGGADRVSLFPFQAISVSKTTDGMLVRESAAGQQAKPEPRRRVGKRSSTQKNATDGTVGNTRPKNAVSPSAEEATEPVSAKKKRVQNFRRHAKIEISGAFPEIVHTLIDRAKEGSVNHTKLLFDIGGVKEQMKEEAKHRERAAGSASLADLLIHELERQHEPEPSDAEQRSEHAATAASGEAGRIDP